jgi:hypothetical protein
MWSAIIQTITVRVGDDSKTIEVTAKVIEGHLAPGMNLEIELNRSMSVSVPIIHIGAMGNSRVKLILDGEDSEHAGVIAALNFPDEALVVTSPSTP